MRICRSTGMTRADDAANMGTLEGLAILKIRPGLVLLWIASEEREVLKNQDWKCLKRWETSFDYQILQQRREEYHARWNANSGICMSGIAYYGAMSTEMRRETEDRG